ncbi:MAG: Oxygen-dependent choline dehydrogenase [Chroococcidiopsis sp. SAG 2025]|uniref:GMC family oxidoreductase n=1 Tax=Chroococcidiopsis sp. SAG 2025 TaxID=171389 RepID=UPI00293721D2|nr:GMC family oxidoreductase [Chroococcidiopsis sp. SAG 2025]MDV2997825.1 Oxygen-dependent choline dehydrogenase [Chroococcidiopsis sp. SAG 2025]
MFDRSLNRRRFLQNAALFSTGLATSLAYQKKAVAIDPSAPVEYIVVGSGAGGGPLAVNLAKAGHKVVLIEAGSDGEADDLIQVPLFSPLVGEDPRVRWDYFVRQYADESRQKRNSKYVADRGGVLYPRAGTLGGCTVHNLMITIYPNNSDWDAIAENTGDPSWKAENMRKYFERMEQCRYVEPSTDNPTRHGFDGWLTTEITDPMLFYKDSNMQQILLSAAREAGDESLLDAFLRKELDPNSWMVNLKDTEGFYNIPQATRNGRRRGPRDLIRETAAALPNNLIVKTNTLVTRVLFRGTTAIGVEYLEGAHLYRADPQAPLDGSEPSSRKVMYAARETILAAGAFNSPQILKLSGIGPADELRQHGIEQIVNLPGVGENLQDRYEVGVITQMNSDFNLTQNCTPGKTSDPCMAQFEQGQGIYTSNATFAGHIRKSDPARPVPDLFIFGLPVPYQGYYPGWSKPLSNVGNQFSWTVLKAHTRNRAGTVKLRSADPRDTPEINFHYFTEGSDNEGEDLASVVNGVEFVRRMNAQIADISQEVIPGSTVRSREEISQFAEAEAWGHHASCSNKMGPKNDPMAVVDSEFRVHGTQNLRVVDASVFPRVPGYFIVTPIYMISEKASDVILASAKSQRILPVYENR